MEEEVRDILRNAAKDESGPSEGLGTAIAALFKGVGLTEDIPELRGFTIEPVKFDE
jgi:plasmid stability protein